MDHVADLDAPCGPEELFGWVDDLSRYPAWLGIVERAEPATASPSDAGPAWLVDLTARVGPFSRSKRLRMVRTACDAPRRVTFARRELDGREHGVWELTADVSPTGSDSSHLRMHLHYGGRLWGQVLEPVLGEEIERSRGRLLDLVGRAAS